jgi:hypothetical protein
LDLHIKRNIETLGFSEQGADESIWTQDAARSRIRDNFVIHNFLDILMEFRRCRM